MAAQTRTRAGTIGKPMHDGPNLAPSPSGAFSRPAPTVGCPAVTQRRPRIRFAGCTAMKGWSWLGFRDSKRSPHSWSSGVPHLDETSIGGRANKRRAGHHSNSSPPIRRAAASLQEIPSSLELRRGVFSELQSDRVPQHPFNCSTAALAAMSQDSGTPCGNCADPEPLLSTPSDYPWRIRLCRLK
jgi:hypothetical protein